MKNIILSLVFGLGLAGCIIVSLLTGVRATDPPSADWAAAGETMLSLIWLWGICLAGLGCNIKWYIESRPGKKHKDNKEL